MAKVISKDNPHNKGKKHHQHEHQQLLHDASLPHVSLSETLARKASDSVPEPAITIALIGGIDPIKTHVEATISARHPANVRNTQWYRCYGYESKRRLNHHFTSADTAGPVASQCAVSWQQVHLHAIDKERAVGHNSECIRCDITDALMC